MYIRRDGKFKAISTSHLKVNKKSCVDAEERNKEIKRLHQNLNCVIYFAYEIVLDVIYALFENNYQICFPNDDKSADESNKCDYNTVDKRYFIALLKS